MEIFLQFDTNPYNIEKYLDLPSIQIWTQWTKLKKTLPGASKGGTCYTDFIPFKEEELIQHFGLYIFHGLSSTPTLKYKFR